MCGKRKYIFLHKRTAIVSPIAINRHCTASHRIAPPPHHTVITSSTIHVCNSLTHHVIYRVCLNHGFSNFLDGIHHIAHKHAVTHTSDTHTHIANEFDLIPIGSILGVLSALLLFFFGFLYVCLYMASVCVSLYLRSELTLLCVSFGSPRH